MQLPSFILGHFLVNSFSEENMFESVVDIKVIDFKDPKDFGISELFSSVKISSFGINYFIGLIFNTII